VVQYVYSTGIYERLTDNLGNVHSSKNRMLSLTQIGADSRALESLRRQIINANKSGGEYERMRRERIGRGVTVLQEAQNNLS
jgi:hypothetical protein